MSEGEELRRKKMTRGAHRSSATRVITQVNELLRVELNETIISQKRKALLGKADLLAKLDEEIQTLIEEDGLEDEIGQADLVQERIDLAIIKLDSSLSKFKPQVHELPGTETESGIVRECERSADSAHGEGTSDHSSITHDPTSYESHTSTPPHSRTPTPPLSVCFSAHVKLPKLSLKRFNGDLTKWTTALSLPCMAIPP